MSIEIKDGKSRWFSFGLGRIPERSRRDDQKE